MTKKTPKYSKLGKEINESLNEAVKWAKGDIIVPAYEYTPPPHIEVAPVRKSLGLSQVDFASAFGLSVGTVRDWEQGRREPEGPSRILLSIIAKHPEVVQDVLRDNLK